MTTREATVFGWIYGRIERRLQDYDKSGFKVGQAAEYPLAGFGAIHAEAMRQHALSDQDVEEIMQASWEIESVDDDGRLLLPQQGAWQLGYFKGKAGQPLPRADLDIKAARAAKKMTQGQLAELIGVDQAVVSRWESGAVKPNAANLARLREILQ